MAGSILRMAAKLAAAACAVTAMPAHASLDDQFPCSTSDHASLLVAISAFETNKAVLQAMEKEGDDTHVHELGLKPGGSWQDFRYEDEEGHVFAGGNGKAVLLMHGKAYFCAYSGDPSEEESSDEARFHLLLGGEGIEIRGQDDAPSASLLFGDKKARVAATLWEVFGVPGKSAVNEECGAGPMSFLSFGPLTLNFSEDDWVGWFLSDGKAGSAVRTTLANGSGIGSPVGAVAGEVEYFEDSTLGHEFTAGGISGLSAGQGESAPIDTLWAGINCHFR